MSAPMPHRTAHALGDHQMPDDIETFPVRILCGCSSRTRNLHITREGVELLRRTGASRSLIFQSWGCKDRCRQVVKITLGQLYDALRS